MLDPPANCKDLDQCKPGNESADMSRVGNTAGAGWCQETEQQLVTDPDAKGDECRNGRQEIEYDRPNLPLRKQKYVATQHAGDRAHRRGQRERHAPSIGITESPSIKI